MFGGGINNGLRQWTRTWTIGISLDFFTSTTVYFKFALTVFLLAQLRFFFRTGCGFALP